MGFGIETIKLFNRIVVPTPATDNPVDWTLVAALNLEAAAFGYSFSPNLLRGIALLSPVEFAEYRGKLITDLIDLSGAASTHRRLFNDFPYSTPNQYEYLVKRIVGFIAHEFNIPLGGKSLTPLSCGHVIDSNLFDAAKFGACPICQYAVDELSSPDVAKYPYASVTPLKVLDTFPLDEITTITNTTLARMGSLSQDEKTFLTNAIEAKVEFTVPENLYRENVPFAYSLLREDIAPALSGATDVLRIASYLSDKDADLSLAAPVRFKLKTTDKRVLLTLLDGMGNLAEDMLRHREKWLRIGEIINPGSAKNKARYPKTASAFDQLRNDNAGIVTFNRTMEKNLRTKVVNTEFVRMMATRPGEFIRKLDFMLRTGEPRVVMGGLRNVLPNASTETLLVIRKYLASRDILPMRMFFPKGQANKVQIVDDTRGALDPIFVTKVIERIDAELKSRFAQLEPMNRVFIDPELQGVLLPFNRRGDSSTTDTSAVSKGSRLPFDGDVVRLFVHWTNGESGRTDVDLSAVLMTDDLEVHSYVSFQNLKETGCVHSGDIQDAPKGASEFIDFDVATLLSQGVRYVTSSVIVFSGPTFDNFPCYAGFMERDSLKSGKVYEPQAVKLKFDINAPNSAHTPLIFDLQERKVIFADLAGGKNRYGAVGQQQSKFKMLTAALLSLPDRKPTVHDLLTLHAEARGTVVDKIEDADTVYKIEDAAKVIAEGVV